MRSPSKRRIFFWTVTVVAVLSAIVLVATWPVIASYESKSALVQRVELDEAAANLFGDTNPYQEIGSPQMLVIQDRKALLPGKSRSGAQMLSENYLKDRKLYPLQLKTVHYVGGLVRMGSGIALTGSLLLLGFLQYRRSRSNRS